MLGDDSGRSDGTWKRSLRNFQRVAEEARTVVYCLAVPSEVQWL